MIDELSPPTLLHPAYHLFGFESPDELNDLMPMVPIDAPGMPRPGPNFLAEALRRGGSLPVTGRRKKEASIPSREWVTELYRSALYRSGFRMTVAAKGIPSFEATFVAGHLWSPELQCGIEDDWRMAGPTEATVMVVGKHPGFEEVQALTNFCGSTSQILEDALQEAGVSVDESGLWYVTNLVRFLPPRGRSKKLPFAADWIKDCLPLLHQELRLIQPKYLLCLGADAAKAVIGKGFKLTGESSLGRSYELRIPTKTGSEHVVKTMCILHPAAVAYEPEQYDLFASSISTFVSMTHGVDINQPETDIDHQTIWLYEHLVDVVDQAIEETRDGGAISFDAEWHGEYPWEPHSFLRTVQFSHKPKFGAVVVLRFAGGRENPYITSEQALEQLTRLVDETTRRGPIQILGHNFKADLPWLQKNLGLNLIDRFDGAPTWQQTKTMGGFDTSIATHACFEVPKPMGFYKLEVICARLLRMRRWDIWIHEFKRLNPMSVSKGYGLIPDCPEFFEYAAYDVDGTRRLYDLLNGDGKPGLLDRDDYGLSSRRGFWYAQRAALAFMEIEQTGILVDRDRIRQLTDTFLAAATAKLTELRVMARWPSFNPNSVLDKRELLFGWKFAGRRDKVTNQLVRGSPADALLFDLTPIGSTDKPRALTWKEAVDRGMDLSTISWSTDKTTIGNLILQHNHPGVMLLHDYMILAHVTKTILRPPGLQIDEETGNAVEIPDRGILEHVAVDGRVRTHFRQVETGRVGSFRPNLQNIQQRRDEKFEKLLGEKAYEHKLRSIFVADPGHVLVSADFSVAEVAVTAWMSGDKALEDMVRRSLLDESDKDYLDLHVELARVTFRLDGVRTKKDLARIGKKGLRIAAKGARFGFQYGQGPESMTMKANEEGAGVTVHEMAELQKTLKEMHPQMHAFFQAAYARPTEQRFISMPFGNNRRWPRLRDDDQARIAEFGRESMNASIQGTVAKMLELAMANFMDYRRENKEVSFRFLLQVHDSLMFLVPDREVEHFVSKVVPECMQRKVQLTPTDFDGRPLPVGPFQLGVGVDVEVAWGEGLTEEEAVRRGIPLQFVS